MEGRNAQDWAASQPGNLRAARAAEAEANTSAKRIENEEALQAALGAKLKEIGQAKAIEKCQAAGINMAEVGRASMLSTEKRIELLNNVLTAITN